MFVPFTCLLHCYWGILTKFEEKGRRIISAYLANIKQNYKKKVNYWHNFRNIGALLVAYYATFSSTIWKPKGKGNSEGRGGGRQFKNEAISQGVGVAFRGVFPEAVCKIGELSVPSYNMHTFQNFLAVLPPPQHYTKLKFGKNSGYTRATPFLGWGEGLDLCELENAPETRKCPKTFVHDWRFRIQNILQTLL